MNNTAEGVLLKGIGGFYYVDVGGKVFETRARGLFREKNIKPVVGDKVVINNIDETNNTAFLYEVLERENELLRPSVSNVSQIVNVISVENPKPNLYLLDKVIACAELQNIDVLICINKTDLNSAKEYYDIYKNAGFKVFEVSTINKSGFEDLKKDLIGKISVFAGNSGVGKSSLINLLLGENFFETGEVSKRVERGKHTTRHSELKALPEGGYIIDTPGFGSLDFADLDNKDFEIMFREFKQYSMLCKYNDCSHLSEKDCAIISAVSSGKIEPSRYKSFRLMIESYKNNKINK